MGDEIRDLDDVEAQAWATIYAAWSTFAHESAEGHADDGVRLLRERRRPSALRDDPQIAEMAVERERAAIVAWLRAAVKVPGSMGDLPADAIERGEHDR